MIPLLCALLAGPPTVEPSAFVGASMRRLFFKDKLTPTLAGWQSGALAMVGMRLEAYPATGKLPVIDDIGPYGFFARSAKNSTLTADGDIEFDTQQTSWELGLRWRAKYGGLTIGYGSQKYDFTGAQLPGFLLPSGLVQYWRPALEGAFSIGPVGVRGGASYLFIVRHDFLAANFPRASKGGVDLYARASMDVWRKLFVNLTARYQRYFYSLHPEPYDPYIAGGALDEVFAVDLACGYRL